MNETIFKTSMLLIALVFTAFFASVVLPPLIANPDILSALSAGFVNPYASGYSTDVILCWIVLAIWVFYESRTLKVKHGCICVLLGAFPGVAVGLPLYILLRAKQLRRL